MAQLRQDYDQYKARDAEVVVVGPEDAGKFRDYFSKHSLPFVGLPDPTHKVLKLYKQKVNLFRLGRMPAQAVVDKGGIVRYVHFGHSMQDIPANADMLAIFDRLNAEAPAGA
jgi:peroxiredoxin